MKTVLYINELYVWLRRNQDWPKRDKIKLLLWLLSFAWTTLAVVFLALVGSNWLVVGLYLLNYPTLLVFKPYIVKQHKFAWRRNYDNPY